MQQRIEVPVPVTEADVEKYHQQTHEVTKILYRVFFVNYTGIGCFKSDSVK